MNAKDTEFYYGTSTALQLGDWLEPTPRAIAVGKKKIQVTNNIDAAIYYANRAVERLTGTPVVYIVEPVLRDLQQKNKTDFITSKAKIIGIKDITELNNREG